MSHTDICSIQIHLDYENKDQTDVLGEETKNFLQGISETLPK